MPLAAATAAVLRNRSVTARDQGRLQEALRDLLEAHDHEGLKVLRREIHALNHQIRRHTV